MLSSRRARMLAVVPLLLLLGGVLADDAPAASPPADGAGRAFLGLYPDPDGQCQQYKCSPLLASPFNCRLVQKLSPNCFKITCPIHGTEYNVICNGNYDSVPEPIPNCYSQYCQFCQFCKMNPTFLKCYPSALRMCHTCN